MRTTFNLDDDLRGEAQRLTGIAERTASSTRGLRALSKPPSEQSTSGRACLRTDGCPPVLCFRGLGNTLSRSLR